MEKLYTYIFNVDAGLLETFEGRWAEEKFRGFLADWSQKKNHMILPSDLPFHAVTPKKIDLLNEDSGVSITYVGVEDVFVNGVMNRLKAMSSEAVDAGRYDVAKDIIDCMEWVSDHRWKE